MRRWFLLITLSLVFVSLTLFGFGSWLFQSTAGTTWLIRAVADVTDVPITIGQLEGRLADELIIGELVVVWPDGKLTIKRLHLDWDPFSVLQKKLNIRVLEVDQLVILETGSDGPPETRAVNESETAFAANDLVVLPSWLTVEIASLQIIGISYQDDEGVAVIADELSGSYLWSQWQINSSKFSYLSPYVNLRGTFDWDLQKPHLEMTANVHLPETLVEPSLFQDIVVPVDFPGQVSFEGDWNSFSGPVTFGVNTQEQDNVWLAAEAHGSWQEIRFENLQGQYLNGSLAGDLDLAWIDSYRMHGALTGAGLDLGLIVEDLDGRTHLDVSGELLVPYDEQPLRASLGAVIHSGQLRGHNVAGNLAANWQNGGLNEISLDLVGDGAKVVVQGKPAERLDLDLDIDDLSPFSPELAGQLTASGWLRWADGYLTGEVHGSTENLSWQETSFTRLTFNGQHLAPQASLALQLDGEGFRYSELQADHLQLGLSGTLEKHDVQIMMNGVVGELALKLAGQYRDEIWRAELETLSGQTSTLGAWSLEQPAHIVWKSGVSSLKDFSLLSRRGERVSLKVYEWGGLTNTQVELTWHELNHDWIAYLQPKHMSSGRSSGELFLDMEAHQPVSLKARLTADAELQNDLSVVTVPVLTAEAVWLKDGLDLSIAAESDDGETFELSAHSSRPPSWQWPPEQLSLDMHWQGLNLERLSHLSEELESKGLSDGHVQLEIFNGQLLRANARISADGLMQQKTQPVGFRSLLADLNWDEKHFQCNAHVEGAHEGILDLSLTSTDSPRFAWPDSGQIDFSINKLSLQSLNPFLSDEVTFDGVLHGKSRGYWQADGQIFLDGQVQIADGVMSLHNSDGQFEMQLQQADVDWQWQGEHLKGSFLLQLVKEGELHGSWQLPLPARWSTGFVADGALQASLQGKLRASGMLAALAPGLVQDLHGQIESDLQATGTWQDPVFSGHVTLSEAGAYLPSSGVTIEDLEVRTVLDGAQIKIEDLSLRSGPGKLNGSGAINFDRWQLEHYQLAVKGERLQVYNFPELQVLCNPDFTLTGDLKSIRLHGSLLIPEMSLLGTTATLEASPSNDVVIAELDHDDRKTMLHDTDIRIAVELGDQVTVKTSGVATRLTGGGIITLNKLGQLATFGAINLVDGVYKGYGATLDIKQGLLNYTGGSITNPDLRIFAARDVGTVQAGVQITGTGDDPVVSLYSRPSMPERDILSYIFIGRPMRVDQEGEDAMMIGTGALMPYGDTFSDLGISEVDIQGLFDGTGGVRLRNRLTERLELESTLGAESGVDLYYILKFD